MLAGRQKQMHSQTDRQTERDPNAIAFGIDGWTARIMPWQADGQID